MENELLTRLDALRELLTLDTDAFVTRVLEHSDTAFLNATARFQEPRIHIPEPVLRDAAEQTMRVIEECEARLAALGDELSKITRTALSPQSGTRVDISG
jgi:hypothetical protein